MSAKERVPIRALTLVFNPNAKKPRWRPPSAEKLRRVLGPEARIHVTRNLEDLDRVMKGWRGKDETLCFFGGDGSIACGLTSLIRYHGEKAALPPVLAVRAGTINMLCSILGFRESVDRTLTRWTKNELHTERRIPLLRVQVDDQPPRYGFVFSWGVGYRVLREYYSRRKVPDGRDAALVMCKTFFSACRPYAAQTPMFRPEDPELELDGKAIETEPVYSLVAGTIARLSLGIKPFAPEPILPGGFHVAANAMPALRVALHAPTLLFQFGDQRKLAEKVGPELFSATGARELRCRLSEGFTMDGEMFEIPPRARVRISAGPVARFWTKGA